MPETEDTEYDLPIPLRDNASRFGVRAGSKPWPNPYSRIEVLIELTSRVTMLATIVKAAGRPVDPLRLAEVLDQLGHAMVTATSGDLEALEDLRDALSPPPHWMDAVREILWPSVG